MIDFKRLKEIEMKVNIKKLHENAVIPQYAKHGDAGLDLTAISKYFDDCGNVCFDTGIAIEIPHGYVGLIFPRSSLSKTDLSLANHVGVIDSGYRGSIQFRFKPVGNVFEDDGSIINLHPIALTNYEIGDRIGQLIIMPYPQIEFNEVDELSHTDRGVGSFGSTDPITKAIESNCE